MRRIIFLAATREEVVLFSQARGLPWNGWRFVDRVEDVPSACSGGRQPQVVILPTASANPEYGRIRQALDVRGVLFLTPEEFR